MYYRWQGSTTTSSELLVPRQEPAFCEAVSLGTGSTATSIPVPEEQVTEPPSADPIPPAEVVPLSQSPAPSYRSTDVESARTSFATWAQESAARYPNRPSRASSIVSTRTKFSTTTIQDDARSIDLSIGSFSFRINRDGSRITTFNNRESIPPYSLASIDGTIDEERPQSSQADDLTIRGDDSSILSAPGTPIEGSVDSAWNLQRAQSPTSDPEPSLSTPSISEDYQSSRTSFTSVSVHQHRDLRSAGVQTGGKRRVVAPQSRRQSGTSDEDTIVLPETPRRRRTLSQNDVLAPNKSSGPTNPQRRRSNGLRLPSLTTGSSASIHSDSSSPVSDVDSTVSGSPASRFTRSAGPAFPERAQVTDTPNSPTSIGRGAIGALPNTLPTGETESSSTLGRSEETPSGTNLAFETPAPTREELGDNAPLRKVDSENEISNHYTRMIRFIDREHRRTLHAKDREMAELRERINDIDTVYRQELRERDFQIDDLKKRLSHLEDNTQVIVQRARNEVEDLWESWWKDRDFHLTERMRRIEKDAQSLAERAVAERDKLWRISWTRTYDQLIERLKEIEGGQYDVSEFDNDGSYGMVIEILSSMSGLPNL